MKTFRFLLAVTAIAAGVISCNEDEGKDSSKTEAPVLDYLKPESGGSGDEIKIVGDNLK